MILTMHLEQEASIGKVAKKLPTNMIRERFFEEYKSKDIQNYDLVKKEDFEEQRLQTSPSVEIDSIETQNDDDI